MPLITMKPRTILLHCLLAAAFVTFVAATEESREPARPSATLWSLRRLEPPTFPPGASNSAVVDAFINARLKEQSLAMSAAADRPTLIRRLMFDLIGLPPSPKEIDQFVNDKSPCAYQNLV